MRDIITFKQEKIRNGNRLCARKQNNNIIFREFDVLLDGNDWPYKVYALDLDAVKSYIYGKFIVGDELSFRVFEITRTKVLDFEMGYYQKIK